MTPEEAQAIYAAGPEAVVRELCALHDQVVALQHQVMAQEKKIAQLSKNSTNSSKPPSSDITKPPKKKKNKGKNNKRGGQPGHPKHERKPFSPDEINDDREYHPLSCPECDNTDITLADLPPRIIQI